MHNKDHKYCKYLKYQVLHSLCLTNNKHIRRTRHSDSMENNLSERGWSEWSHTDCVLTISQLSTYSSLLTCWLFENIPGNHSCNNFSLLDSPPHPYCSWVNLDFLAPLACLVYCTAQMKYKLTTFLWQIHSPHLRAIK